MVLKLFCRNHIITLRKNASEYTDLMANQCNKWISGVNLAYYSVIRIRFLICKSIIVLFNMSARGKDGFVKTFFVKKKYLARVKNLENVGMDPTVL